MTRTSPKIAFGLYALEIKQDATPTCSDVQTFSKVDDLITGNVTSKPYATFEPNFWVLDGGYKFKPSTDAIVHVGLWSLSMTDENGDFDTPPELTITFGSVQDTDGLTLRFASYSVDYANDIDVAYYNASNVLIRTDNYTPTSWEFSTSQAVSSFKKIIITFNSTNKPYRYLRLTGIDFGELIYFTNVDIKSAIVKQENNPLSLTLPIDTLELSLFSSDAALSIINPTGDYAKLKEKQPLDVYELVDSEQIYLGQFYLDKWQNPSNNEIIFNCVDMLGILDEIPYLYGGPTDAPYNATPINSVPASILIADIMGKINVPYYLDPDLEDVDVMGWIPVGSYRETLQIIALAIGANITCSRMGVLQIYKTVLASELTEFDHALTSAEKSLDQLLTLAPLVTGVEITSHKYYYEETSTTQIIVYDGYLPIGQHTIQTTEPVLNVGNNSSTATFTILDAGINFVQINVTVAGNVSITANRFSDTKRIVGIYNETLPASTMKNIVKIDCTLANDDNVDEIAQRVYDYFQMRYLQNVKLYAANIAPGDSVLVDTLYDSQIGGVFEKITFDLSRGFTSKVEIRGDII